MPTAHPQGLRRVMHVERSFFPAQAAPGLLAPLKVPPGKALQQFAHLRRRFLRECRAVRRFGRVSACKSNRPTCAEIAQDLVSHSSQEPRPGTVVRRSPGRTKDTWRARSDL